MVWDFVPRARHRGMFGCACCVVVSGGCGWGGVGVVGLPEGIFDGLGVCLYLVQNSLGVSIAKISLFWIVVVL